MSRDFRHDTEIDPNMRPSSPVSELVDLRECLDRFVEAFPAAADYPIIKRGYTSLTTLSTHNAELEREVKRLREVMQPFSVFAGVVFERNFNNDDPVDTMTASDGGIVHLYARDFFAIRAALSTSPQGGKTDNERIREGMERILKEQSERDIPFAPQGGEHGE